MMGLHLTPTKSQASAYNAPLIIHFGPVLRFSVLGQLCHRKFIGFLLQSCARAE